MKKYILIVLLLSMTGCSRPHPVGKAFERIDVSKEPVQCSFRGDDWVVKGINHGEFVLSPVAGYSISAVVVSKKSYSHGWQAQISPLDLALVWGKLAEPGYDKFISYSQGNRWYYWRYSGRSPLRNPYISRHSSNNHIIPANNNVFLAMRTIRKKEKVKLEGYLVRLSGKYKGRDYWWNSSLSRSDGGDDSCEVFYVERVQRGNKVYE